MICRPYLAIHFMNIATKSTLPTNQQVFSISIVVGIIATYAISSINQVFTVIWINIFRYKVCSGFHRTYPFEFHQFPVCGNMRKPIDTAIHQFLTWLNSLSYGIGYYSLSQIPKCSNFVSFYVDEFVDFRSFPIQIPHDLRLLIFRWDRETYGQKLIRIKT